jgi:hypothetical protein
MNTFMRNMIKPELDEQLEEPDVSPHVLKVIKGVKDEPKSKISKNPKIKDVKTESLK